MVQRLRGPHHQTAFESEDLVTNDQLLKLDQIPVKEVVIEYLTLISVKQDPEQDTVVEPAAELAINCEVQKHYMVTCSGSHAVYAPRIVAITFC